VTASPPARRPAPVSFGDEPTRQVDDALLSALRNAPPAKAAPKPPPTRPEDWHGQPPPIQPARPDEPTRLANISAMLPGLRREAQGEGREGLDGNEEMTRPADDFRRRPPAPGIGGFEENRDPDEATRLSSLESMTALERARGNGSPSEDRTRAVNIRSDPSFSDIDWDLD
jgi:hypothetical protein